MEIVYGVGDSDLGLVLVARDADGVCAVFLEDDVLVLEEELARRFKGASLRRSEDEIADELEDVLGLVMTPGKVFTHAISMHGTPFQQRVWVALQEIPAGQTTTYKDVATRIGKPTAVRAVAGAIGANKLSLIVPCHRVLGTDGSLTGYRWGVERKRWLLDRE